MSDSAESLEHGPSTKWILTAIAVSIVAGGLVGGLVDAVAVATLNSEVVLIEVDAGLAAGLAVAFYGIVRFAGDDIAEVIRDV